MEEILNKWFATIDSGAQAFWASKASSLASALLPLSRMLLVAYVAWIGYKVLFGDMNGHSLASVVKKTLVPFVVVQIALNLGYYTGFIADSLWHLPEDLVDAAGGTHSEKGAFLAQIYNQFYELSKVLWTQANAAESNSFGLIPDLSFTIASVSVLLSGVILVGYAAFLFSLAKLGIAVMLALGPAFVLLAAFESTRKFFESWLGQIVSLTFTIVVSTLLSFMTLEFLDRYITVAVENVSSTSGSEAAWPTVLITGVILLLLRQVPAWASALGGGVAITTMGTGSAAASRTKRAMKSLLNRNKGADQNNRSAGTNRSLWRRGNAIRNG